MTARATVGAGTVALEGPVAVGEDAQAALHLEATSIDVHAIVAEAPASSISATGDIVLSSKGPGEVAADATLEVAAGRIASLAFPPATIHASATHGASTTTAEATLSIRDPAAPTTATLRLVPEGESFSLAFEATARAANLTALTQEPSSIGGHATAKARGKLDLARGLLEATVEADAGGLSAGPVRVGHASVQARASGALAAPSIDASVHGGDIHLGQLHFATLDFESHGSALKAPVTIAMLGPRTRLDAHADVALGDGVTVRDLVTSFDDNGHRAAARAARIRITPSEV